MREIKFRAWDKRSDQMLYSNEQQTVWMGGLTPSVNVNTNHKQVAGDFVGMQFTGLKDKNGKEIYEGDIVRRVHLSGTKEYLNKQSYVIQWQINKYNILSAKVEVIGNIYENPNLIQTGV